MASNETSGGPVIGIVAGEASGDLLASRLMQALRERLPGVRFVGIGGPKMAAVGMEVLFPLEKLAVRGYVEVLRHYREIVGIRRQLKRHFLNQRPELFIGVDAPDFNLKLERALKARGIPVAHYVGPSIWAWRGERIHAIRKAVDRMLLLFPFEKALYDQAGIPATYVGHPLADMLPEHPDRRAMREQLRLPLAAPVVALLPGSRQSELRHLAQLFVRAALLLHARFPEMRFLVPLLSRETRRMFEEALFHAGGGELPLTILFGHAHDAMIAADAVLVASGTATLEAALLQRPMVITYSMPGLSWRIIQRKKYQPWVGLPNILAGRFVVPELLQDDATPENLAQALGNLIDDKRFAEATVLTLAGLQQSLRRDSAARSAEAVVELLGRQAEAA